MTLARLLVLLSLDATGFNRGIYLAMGQMQALERSLTNFSNLSASLSSVGGLFTRYLTVPILSVVAAATVMGTSINKEMGQIQTLLSGGLAETTQRAERLRTTAQNLAIEFAIGTSQMTEGMYEMISAFDDSMTAINGLRIASLMAKAGNVDLLETVRMLVGQAKIWADSFSSPEAAMRRISDLAFRAAAIGQTTIPELVDAIGKVGPMAQQAGIDLEQFFAVFASVPGTVGTTSQVATMFRSVLRSLLDPTKALKAAYKELGIESVDMAIKTQGFVPVLQQLLKYSGDSGESFGNLIGRVEGWTIALALAGELNGEYNRSLAEMNDAMGASERAFQTVTQGIGTQAFTWEQLGIKAQVLMQRLQEGLAPALGQLLEQLTPVADKAIELADAFAELDPATQQQIVNWGLFAVALGPALRILSGVVTAISLLWGAVSVAGPAVGAFLLSIAGPLTLIMIAVTALAVVWNLNWFNIQERTAAARAAIIPHMDAIKAAYDNWISTVQQTDFSSWDGFWASMANNRAAFVNMMYEIGQATQDAIAAFAGFQNATAFGMAAIRQMQDAFNGAKATVAGWAASFVERLYATSAASAQFGAMLGTSIRNASSAAGQAVLNLASQIASGLRSAFAQAIAAAGSAVSGIKSAFTSVGWSSIGSSIVSGIAAGIRAGAGTIASAAASAASAALGAAKSLLGIKSPSSVMALQVGIPIAQGLALGMLNGISYIEDAANRMIAPVTGLSGGPGFAFAGAGGGGMVIQIENNFNGPVSDATVAQVEDTNRRSITAALRGEGYL